MELKQYVTSFSNSVTQLIVLVSLMAWYGLGIYLVVVTLAIEPFHERERQLSALYPGGFNHLRILENKEAIALKAVAEATTNLDELKKSIKEVDAIIYEYELKTTRIGTATALEKNEDKKSQLKADLAIASHELNQLFDKRKKIYEPRKKSIENLRQIQSKIKLDERKAIGVLKRLDIEKKQLTTYANIFFLMPQEMLTLILTLSMGILGSTIVVSRAVLTSTPKEVRLFWFLIRPLQGAIIALAVFILAKAGIVVLASQPLDSGVSIELNPFTIGFLGIVSGLYADHAYEYLEQIAARFFQTASNHHIAD